MLLYQLDYKQFHLTETILFHVRSEFYASIVSLPALFDLNAVSDCVFHVLLVDKFISIYSLSKTIKM